MGEYFRIKGFLFREQIRTILRYYPLLRFALIDLLFGLVALFLNPYRTCRKFLQKKGAREVHVYGETPFSTFEQLVEAVGLSKNDQYVELGSGRGKTCFWAALMIGCSVRGIEQVPFFVRLAQGIARLFQIKATFTKACISQIRLDEATVVYFSPINLEIDLFIPTFTSLPIGARFITLSEPFCHPEFCIIKTISVNFAWGETEAFIQVREKRVLG